MDTTVEEALSMSIIDPTEFGALRADVSWLRMSFQSMMDRMDRNDSNCDLRCKECAESFNGRIEDLETASALNHSRIKMLMVGAWSGASGFVVLLIGIIGYFLKRHFENGT